MDEEVKKLARVLAQPDERERELMWSTLYDHTNELYELKRTIRILFVIGGALVGAAVTLLIRTA